MLKKTILYVDIYIGGHHPSYSRGILLNLIKMDIDVILLTAVNALHSPAYRELLNDLSGRVTLCPLINVNNTATFVPEPIRVWFSLRRALHLLKKNTDLNYDGVFIANLSGVYQAIALLGSPFGHIPISGLMVTVRYHLGQLGLDSSVKIKRYFQEMLFIALLRKSIVRNIIAIDATLHDHPRTKLYINSSKLVILEHPWVFSRLQDYSVARRKLGASEAVLIVLVFGALSRRKAIDTLLVAASHPSLLGHIMVIVAGQPDNQTFEIMRSESALILRARGLLLERLLFVDEQEESLLFAASDVVWVAYRNFLDTSGILLSAYYNAKPVIGCQKGIIAQSIEKNSTGIKIDPESSDEAVRALHTLLSVELRRQMGTNGKKVVQSRDPERFFDAVADLLFKQFLI